MSVKILSRRRWFYKCNEISDACNCCRHKKQQTKTWQKKLELKIHQVQSLRNKESIVGIVCLFNEILFLPVHFCRVVKSQQFFLDGNCVSLLLCQRTAWCCVKIFLVLTITIVCCIAYNFELVQQLFAAKKADLFLISVVWMTRMSIRQYFVISILHFLWPFTACFHQNIFTFRMSNSS